MIEINYYSRGNFGLVDTFHLNLWLLVEREEIAHLIKKTFVSKLRLVVFDLTIFSNYLEQNIDNSCCISWHLPAAPSSQLARESTVTFNNEIINSTQKDYPELQLISKSNTGVYDPGQRFELQTQMLFYEFIVKRLSITSPLLPGINKIFLVELNLDTIKDRLHQFGVSQLENHPHESARLLGFLEKLYD